MRTTTGSGSLVYCMSEPCRSLKRAWHTLQYNRRMDLSLPISSHTLRLPAPKQLKARQSGLGQANRANGDSCPARSPSLARSICLADHKADACSGAFRLVSAVSPVVTGRIPFRRNTHR
jgi:hypothetical protein